MKDFFISLRPYQNIQSSSGSGSSYLIRSNFKKLLSEHEEIVINYLSKTRTFDSILNLSKLSLDELEAKELLRKMYESSIIFFNEK